MLVMRNRCGPWRWWSTGAREVSHPCKVAKISYGSACHFSSSWRCRLCQAAPGRPTPNPSVSATMDLRITPDRVRAGWAEKWVVWAVPDDRDPSKTAAAILEWFAVDGATLHRQGSAAVPMCRADRAAPTPTSHDLDRAARIGLKAHGTAARTLHSFGISVTIWSTRSFHFL